MTEDNPEGIPSYPKVWNLGHPHLKELFDDPVIVEEKVDGSQFSFMRTGSPGQGSWGSLVCRSRGRHIVIDAPDNMFAAAVATVRELEDKLRIGWVYRGEYLRAPKHNALTYKRVPKKHVVIFDIMTGPETYLAPESKDAEAARLGLESVPRFFEGKIFGVAEVLEFMQRESFLGGPLVEGLVFKNYRRFGRDGKVLMGKHVSEAFKETHRKEWGESNPSQKDVLERISDEYRSPVRWEKAIQHLRDAGRLENSPRDIGALIKEVQRDLDEECAEEIKDRLYAWAKKHLMRRSIAGLPEWYKARLVEAQFNENAGSS